MVSCGIDAGARTTKVLLLDEKGGVLARVLRPSGPNPAVSCEAVFEEALARAGLCRTAVRNVVATGYGRVAIPFATRVVTEITCHARGVRYLAPAARTIVDIGGQDSKIIFLDANGMVRDFAMNERCAAGTGRFLEVLADIVHLRLEDLGAVAAHARSPAAISSTCAIFAESEVIGLLARGCAPADIVAGVHEALAKRVVSLCRGIRAVPPVVFTGGVALNAGMVAALSCALGEKVQVPAEPQMVGALGAALLAAHG